MLQADSRWPYPNFTPEEVACKCGCGLLPSARMMDMAQELRDLCGFALPTSSGARCEAHNRAEGGAENSEHTTGEAIDFKLFGERFYIAVGYAMQLGFTGIGVSQKTGSDLSSRFGHFGIRPRAQRLIWSY